MLIYKLKTAIRLGLPALFDLYLHKIKLKTEYYLIKNSAQKWAVPFQAFTNTLKRLNIPEKHLQALEPIYLHCKENKFQWYFSDYYKVPSNNRWHFDPVTQTSLSSQSHWAKLNLFRGAGNDIKNIWELSRFYWLPQLTLIGTKNLDALVLINQLLSDWIIKNPPNTGVQWACGQETAIRLINFVLAQEGLTASDTVFRIDFIITHLKRIAATLPYAIAQQNNHATSEAAGLIVGGCFLSESSLHRKAAYKHIKKGVKLLTNAASKLIMQDGGFSQYSVTYHRLLLDSISLSVLYLKKYNLKIPGALLQKHSQAAAWVTNLKIERTTNLPNLGSNDGTLLFNLKNHDYRDFTYTVDLASYVAIIKNEEISKLSVLEVLTSLPKSNTVRENNIDLSDFGLIKLKHPNRTSTAFLRYPNFNKSFRPAQADMLHLDLWDEGKNILIDSGTFSYNPKEPNLNLKATKNHNTIYFKKNEQMPVISRFLYGEWPRYKNKSIDFDNSAVDVLWRDYQKNIHGRKITATDTGWEIVDAINESGDLYWHLGDLDWQIKDGVLFTDCLTITVAIGKQVLKPEIKKMHDSLYYQKLSEHIVAIYALNRLVKGNLLCTTTINFIENKS